MQEDEASFKKRKGKFLPDIRHKLRHNLEQQLLTGPDLADSLAPSFLVLTTRNPFFGTFSLHRWGSLQLDACKNLHIAVKKRGVMAANQKTPDFTFISLNSFRQGWLIKFAAYFSIASKAVAAFNAEKLGIHLALCQMMSEVNGWQNFRSCGTKHKYWWTKPKWES